MNDEQLVLALIASYKSRGVDLSKLLDDPLFDKLPAWSKIKAIQTHAGTLHDGVNPRPSSTDYKRIAYNSLFSGAAGALAGQAIGARIGSISGLTPGLAALMGGALGAGSGVLVGATNALSSVDNRRQLKQRLNVAKEDPSIPNAVSVLSHSHTSSESRTLRDEILKRIGTIGDHSVTERMEPMLKDQHKSMLEMNARFAKRS